MLASSGDWRLMLGLAAVPSLILLLGMAFMPETPRFLVRKGEEDERPEQKIREIQEVEEEEKRAARGSCSGRPGCARR